MGRRATGTLTPQRVRGLAYLRSCIAEGQPISVTEMVSIGAGANRFSAKRILKWAANEIQRPPLPEPTAPEPPWITIAEAAAAAALGEEAIRELIGLGEIRVMQVGNHHCVDVESFRSSCWMKHPLVPRPDHRHRRRQDAGSTMAFQVEMITGP